MGIAKWVLFFGVKRLMMEMIVARLRDRWSKLAFNDCSD